MRKIVILILTVLLQSCNGIPKTGVAQYSQSINQSKENNVFINQYTPTKQFLLINNDTLKIKEVFIEKSWYYKNANKEVEIEGNNNLIIKTNRKLIDVPRLNWNIKNSIYFGETNFAIICGLPIQELSKSTLIIENSFGDTIIGLIKK